MMFWKFAWFFKHKDFGTYLLRSVKRCQIKMLIVTILIIIMNNFICEKQTGALVPLENSKVVSLILHRCCQLGWHGFLLRRTLVIEVYKWQQVGFNNAFLWSTLLNAALLTSALHKLACLSLNPNNEHPKSQMVFEVHSNYLRIFYFFFKLCLFVPLIFHIAVLVNHWKLQCNNLHI